MTAGEVGRFLEGKAGPIFQVFFLVAEDCNLACSYCYETDKQKHRMTAATACQCVDSLFQMDGGAIINEQTANGINLTFFGGEPTLNLDAVEAAVDRFQWMAVTRRHRWARNYVISLDSNGTLYFSEQMQRLLCRHKGHIICNISVDGSKESHDACRVFPDGRGSYDAAHRAMLHAIEHQYMLSTKVTISPENLPYLAEGCVSLLHHMEKVFCSCALEPDWQVSHARELFEQMKEITERLLSDPELCRKTCTLFGRWIKSGTPGPDRENYCGGIRTMIAFDADGVIYPCPRCMPLCSCGGRFQIGTAASGLGKTQAEQSCIQEMSQIMFWDKQDEECRLCPLVGSCPWCDANDFVQTGSILKKSKRICWMHRARALGTVYYWMRRHEISGDDPLCISFPESWARELSGPEDWAKLKPYCQEVNNVEENSAQ